MNLNLFADSPILQDILGNPLISILPGGPKLPPGLIRPRRKMGGAISDDIINASKAILPTGSSAVGSVLNILGPILLPILIKKGVDAFKKSDIKKQLPPEINDILNEVSTKTLEDILAMQPQISDNSKSILDRVLGEGIAII